MKYLLTLFTTVGLIASSYISPAAENSDNEYLRSELQQLREDFEEMRGIYEARIKHLENRLNSFQTPLEEIPTPVDELEALRLEAKAAIKQDPSGTPDFLDQPTSTRPPLNIFNPRITVFADLLGRADNRSVRNEEGQEIGDRVGLREVEIDLQSDIDPFAKGVLVLALEEETPNEFTTTIEEGYVIFHTLPFNLRAKAGRFRTGFGQINKLHLHDLPQFNYPLPVRTFLGEEGDNQNGLALSFLFPPIRENIVEFEFQILNGENEQILAGGVSSSPAYLGHLKFFRDIGENQFIELGASYLSGYSDASNELSSHLSGLDFLYKWIPLRRSEYRSFVLQGELFYLDRDIEAGEMDSFGAYLYAQAQFSKRWYVGLRTDWSEIPDDTGGEAWSIGPYASFYPSEFLRLRFGFEHLEKGENPLSSFFFQISFVFGSHPVEPYWFNK